MHERNWLSRKIRYSESMVNKSVKKYFQVGSQEKNITYFNKNCYRKNGTLEEATEKQKVQCQRGDW